MSRDRKSIGRDGRRLSNRIHFEQWSLNRNGTPIAPLVRIVNGLRLMEIDQDGVLPDNNLNLEIKTDFEYISF